MSVYLYDSQSTMVSSMVQHRPPPLVQPGHIHPGLEDGLQSTAFSMSSCQMGTRVASGVNSREIQATAAQHLMEEKDCNKFYHRVWLIHNNIMLRYSSGHGPRYYLKANGAASDWTDVSSSPTLLCSLVDVPSKFQEMLQHLKIYKIRDKLWQHVQKVIIAGLL